MSHKMNRTAFLAAKNSGQPLLAAYGQLVAAEIGLKDHAVTWLAGHDLHNFGLNSLPFHAQIVQAILQRFALILTLNCVILGTNDHAGGTTDAHLLTLVRTVEDIIVQLRAKGVAL
jgi:hypothetical protein